MMAKKLPTDSDYANSNKNLEAEDYEVDYAITYTCPLYQVRTLGCYHVAREEEPLQNYFQWVCDKLNQTNEMLADGSGDKKGRSFKHWYFVHWHTDWNKNWLELMHLEELPQKCRAIYLDVEDMENITEKNILFIIILLQVVYFVYDAYDLTTRRLLKRICRQT